MAKNVNKAILAGNVGQDPDVKYTASRVPVARVSVATNERLKDRNDQWQDRTEWHCVVAWHRLAEIVGEYVRKGSKLNAFTSAFTELDPIPQFRATAKLREFLEARFSQSF